MSIGLEPNALEIEIDWPQYFRDFCEKHGQYPVLYNSTLLFPDGYRYSASDYQGPEWAPPDDPTELNKLRQKYYSRRLLIVREEHRKMDGWLKDIINLQRNLSCPLSQRVTTKDDEGKLLIQSYKLDMVVLNKRLEWLAQDIKDCENMLVSLGVE